MNRQTTHQERITILILDTHLIGVQGRVGKIPDSCYSYWVGASIQILTG